MKTSTNFFSRTILVVGLIFLLGFILPEVKAQNKGVDTMKNRIISKSLIGATFLPVQTTSFHFGQSQEAGVTITWEDKKIDVLYGKGTKPSDAVKQFFN